MSHWSDPWDGELLKQRGVVLLPDGMPPSEKWHIAAVTVAIPLFWLNILLDRDHFIFLDYVNLGFHEAGHFAFLPFGMTLHFLGGTLGQFAVPLAFALYFCRQRNPLAVACCGVWLGENFLYSSHYIADAIRMELPLVGSGMHDWNWLLRRFGILHHCHRIGAVVYAMGWIVMIAASGWYIMRQPLLLRWFKPGRRITGNGTGRGSRR